MRDSRAATILGKSGVRSSPGHVRSGVSGEPSSSPLSIHILGCSPLFFEPILVIYSISRQKIFIMTTTRVCESDLEKHSALHVDNASENDVKGATPAAGADYSGAIKKTDPEEIALVRKLDYRIMPALFCMYFL